MFDFQFPIFDISIHAPREGGDFTDGQAVFFRDISIHAPREGGDDGDSQLAYLHYISIHAPREGGDSTLSFAGV